MPVHLKVIPSERCVVATFIEPVTADDIRAYSDQLRTDPAFEPTFSSLFDLRRAGVNIPTLSEVRSLAGSSAFSSGARRAFVLDSQLHYGVLRLAELSSDGGAGIFKMFDDPAKAAAWLGVPPDLAG